jgi:thymidine kinase
LGKVDKGVRCNVNGCSGLAERSLSREQMAGSGLSVGGQGRRVYLCREHYKTWKKATKKEKSLERARWS